MKFETLTISEAAKKMALWKEDTDTYLKNELDSHYYELREQLLKVFKKINSGPKYTCDYQFGMSLFLTLRKNGFTLRDASNDDVWRYMSLCIIPDIVGKRWGKMAEVRYYKQSGRIWLKTIWWYIFLSWQGNEQDTKKVIAHNSTDQILQLVDRSGTKGYFVDVYRKIMYYYWVAREINPLIGESEFRRVMVLHTAFCKNIEPGFYSNGVDGYVKMLYERLGITLYNE